MKFGQNRLVKNTLIVMIVGFLVKLIGMLAKIYTTRIMGIENMTLYVLSYPTLLLFISISSFSLNQTISKLVSEGISTSKLSPKKILFKGIKQSLILSIIMVIIYLFSISIIANNLLHNKNLYYPLLSGVFLIPLVGISDALRGYYNGLKNMKTSSLSLLLEQLTRSFFSLLLVIIFINKSVVLANCMLFISLSLGEIASIVFCLRKIKKNHLIDIKNTSGESKAVFDMSKGLTISRLFGNLIFFLEPIVYTKVLTYLGYEKNIIDTTYTTIDVLTIPLLTLISFLPFSLSTALIPELSSTNATNNSKEFNNLVHKIISYIYLPSILCLTFIYYYSYELMYLIFKSTNGANLAKQVSFVFISYYFSNILYSILQSIGKVKQLTIVSTILNSLKIILIIILSFNKKIGPSSILYAPVITITISSIIYFYFLFKYTTFKIDKKRVITYTLITLLTIYSIKLLLLFNVNYLIVIISLSILYILLLFKSKLL